MPVDMKVKPEPKEEVKVEEVPQKDIINLGFTREELSLIREALRSHKDFETFVSVVRGTQINKMLLDLDKINIEEPK